MDGVKFSERMHQAIGRRIGVRLKDHKDGNRLDNRESNLRVATHSQNMANQCIQTFPGKTSKYKGVYWKKEKNKWAAQIKVKGKRYFLCGSKSEEECAIVYNVAAQLFFDEFARLNPV